MRATHFLKLAIVVAAASLAACDNNPDNIGADTGGGTSSGGTSSGGTSSGGTSSGGTSSGGTSSGGTSSGGTSSGGTSSGGTSSGGTSSGGTSSGGTSSGGTSSGGTSSGGTSSGGTSSGGTSSGGTSSGGTTTDPDTRTVGPDASASAAADLSTPEKAARFGVVSFQSGLANQDDPAAAQAKAATACNQGGTQDSTQSGFTFRIVYAQCKQSVPNSTLVLLQDGVISTELTGFTSPIQSKVTLGESGVSYLQEVLEPAADRFRTLLVGTIDSTTTSNSQQQPSRSDAQLRLVGAAVNTARSTKPRVDFAVGNASTAYTSNTENLDQRVVKFTFAGPVSVSGACGSGSGTVSTPTKIEFDKQTGQYIAGQMMIQAGGSSATYTFNADNTVTVATAGGSQTFTQAQLQAQCDAFN